MKAMDTCTGKPYFTQRKKLKFSETALSFAVNTLTPEPPVNALV